MDEVKKKEEKWETPKINYVGQVSDVLQQGEGKLSGPPTDPGEPRKVPPSA